MYLHSGVTFLDPICHTADIGICQFPSRSRDLTGSVAVPEPFHSLLKFIEQKAEHSYAVLQLEISVVPLFLRDFFLCQEIPLVARMYKMDPVLFIDLFLPAVDHTKYFPRFFSCKRFQRVQSLPEPGQSHRNDRDALQKRKILCQIADGAFQLLPVVHSSAEDDLAVHL